MRFLVEFFTTYDLLPKNFCRNCRNLGVIYEKLHDGHGFCNFEAEYLRNERFWDEKYYELFCGKFHVL